MWVVSKELLNGPSGWHCAMASSWTQTLKPFRRQRMSPRPLSGYCENGISSSPKSVGGHLAFSLDSSAHVQRETTFLHVSCGFRLILTYLPRGGLSTAETKTALPAGMTAPPGAASTFTIPSQTAGLMKTNWPVGIALLWQMLLSCPRSAEALLQKAEGSRANVRGAIPLFCRPIYPVLKSRSGNATMLYMCQRVRKVAQVPRSSSCEPVAVR
ncbi:unnamed protein product [Protopolystoma xenopodis]|uniref:Uncharacterized protein n=1 Tax=Protopolystoma xenopodis TaxID=117903 RepID=A0A448WK79_9PLAT|nr:unnamed protein product [Protopolystoma xenopodis]